MDEFIVTTLEHVPGYRVRKVLGVGCCERLRG